MLKNIVTVAAICTIPLCAFAHETKPAMPAQIQHSTVPVPQQPQAQRAPTEAHKVPTLSEVRHLPPPRLASPAPTPPPPGAPSATPLTQAVLMYSFTGALKATEMAQQKIDALQKKVDELEHSCAAKK